jgi:hypothetical protein
MPVSHVRIYDFFGCNGVEAAPVAVMGITVRRRCGRARDPLAIAKLLPVISAFWMVAGVVVRDIIF